MAATLLAWLLCCVRAGYVQPGLSFTSPPEGTLLEGKEAEVHFEIRGADGEGPPRTPGALLAGFAAARRANLQLLPVRAQAIKHRPARPTPGTTKTEEDLAAYL